MREVTLNVRVTMEGRGGAPGQDGSAAIYGVTDENLASKLCAFINAWDRKRGRPFRGELKISVLIDADPSV